MPTYIRIVDNKTFPRQRLTLGIPLAIWAVALLMIGMSVHFNVPLATFDPQDQLAPF